MDRQKNDIKVPSTLKRSPTKAQRTYTETLRNAEQEYGVGERASRTAYAALKHGFKKVGDHWESKDSKGEAGEGKELSRQVLYERAKALKIPGRSRMNKAQLARALAKKPE
ncbi:MAG: ChaB family protein [Acidobacteriota bacterium]